MSRVTKFDNLVRLLPEREPEPIGINERLVHYNVKRNRVVASKGVLSWGIRSYVVVTDRWVDHEARSVTISGGARTGDRLELAVQCRLQCPSGNAERVVESLASATKPEALLDDLIVETVDSLEQELRVKDRNPVIEFFDVRADWQRQVAESIFHRTGLRADIRLELANDELETITIEQEPYAIFVDDCDDEIRLSYKLVLDVIPEARHEALVNAGREKALQDNLARRIRKYIHDNVRIHRLCADRQGVEADLKRCIGKHVDSHGRIVSNFRCEWDIPFELPRLTVEKHNHLCEIRNWPEKIEIQHTVLLQLSDIALYRRSQIEDLSGWLKRQLEDITQAELFEREYSEIATDFDGELQSLLQDKMESAAREIGVHVEQYSSVSKMAAKKLLEPQELFDSERELATKDSRVQVKLNIVAYGSVPRLEKVKDHLHEGVGRVLGLIEDEAWGVAREVMHQTQPERFYLHFDNVISDRHERHADERPKPPVEQELRQRIEEHLRVKFDVQARVTVKQADTKLTERFDQLRSARPRLEIVTRPLDGATLKFAISYRVVSVGADQWSVFQAGSWDSAEAEIFDISTLIRERVEEALNNVVPMHLVQYRSPEHRERLKEALFDGGGAGSMSTFEAILPFVLRHYGLVIEITSFGRQDGPQEHVQREQTRLLLERKLNDRESRAKHLQGKLDVLRGQELDIMARDSSDPELDDIRGSIKELEAELTELEQWDRADEHLEPHSLALPPSQDSAFLKRLLPPAEAPEDADDEFPSSAE